MLINLLPDFLAVLDAADPAAAYQRYRDTHRPILDAYWHNYVLDPDSPQAEDVVRAALSADRSDLTALLGATDLVQLVEEAASRAHEVLRIDRPTDCYLMVGMGGANAGELVVGGRGIAFICAEHFTGRVNPETYGMGLSPDLIPLWVAHELAHTVRYTSPSSASELHRLVAEAGRKLRLLADRQPGDTPGAAAQRRAGRARGTGGSPRVRPGRLLRLPPPPVSPPPRDRVVPPPRQSSRTSTRPASGSGSGTCRAE